MFWLIEITYFIITTEAIIYIQTAAKLGGVSTMHFRQRERKNWGLFPETLSATFCTPGIVCSDTSGIRSCVLRLPHCRCFPCRWKPYFLWFAPPGRSPREVEFHWVALTQVSTNDRLLQNVFTRLVWPSTQHVDTEDSQLPQQPKGTMQVKLWKSTHDYLKGHLEFTGRLVLFQTPLLVLVENNECDCSLF